jgi:hypothetical protein
LNDFLNQFCFNLKDGDVDADRDAYGHAYGDADSYVDLTTTTKPSELQVMKPTTTDTGTGNDRLTRPTLVPQIMTESTFEATHF